MRAVLLLVAVLLLPTALAVSGAFTRGDTLADGDWYVMNRFDAGTRIEATLTWSGSDVLEMYVGFRCAGEPPLGLSPPHCYTEYATHEVGGCDGWGTAFTDGSPANLAFTTPFSAVYIIYVRDVVAVNAYQFYTLDVTVNGANYGISQQPSSSIGAGWLSCNVGYEGP